MSSHGATKPAAGLLTPKERRGKRVVSVRVCIACRVWSEIRSRLEIASRLRFDLAGDLISSDPSRVRSGSTPIQSARVPFSCSWGPVGGREAVMSGQPTHPGRTRCPPIPLTFTGPRLFTPQWSLSKYPRAGKAYHLPTGRRGHVPKQCTRGSEPAGTDATRVARSHAVYDPRVANPREGSVLQRVGEPATHVQHERRGVSRARAVRALSHSPSPPHALTPPVCAPSGGLSAPVSVCPVGRSGPVGRSVCSHERLPRRAVVPRRAVDLLP